MEFGWTPEQKALRQKVAAFLDAHLPEDWESIASQSPGSPAVTEFSKQFCPKLAEAGLLASHWPEEFGGAGASAWDHFIVGEMLWEAGEPRGPQYYNVNWIGPAIMQYGTAEQQEQHLGRMLKGDVIWCQGFSEPSAGSDLAALRTRAEREGESYVVNGQKIWTSYARLAEFCFLLARTGAGKKEISVFLIPMDRKGITVRPIDSVVGDGDLHEVFLDDVEVLESERLGQEGLGWEVVRYALNFERVGIPRYALALRTLNRTVAELQGSASFGEGAQIAAASAHSACEAARILVYEAVGQRMKSSPDTGVASIARLSVVRAENQVADFVLDWTPQLFVGDEQPMVATHHKRAISAGIAGGAAEIQLNLIARNVLGLGA
ncbi:MAG: acyl-CoA dehydrogenase family protein [Novosphingobium sp.]|nr:acyl-CoA dehydrogenase family protein [Novosphingobium sp.]